MASITVATFTTDTTVTASIMNSAAQSMVSAINSGSYDLAINNGALRTLDCAGSVTLGTLSLVSRIASDVNPSASSTFSIGSTTAYTKLYVNGCVASSVSPPSGSVYGNSQMLAYGSCYFDDSGGSEDTLTSIVQGTMNCTMTSSATGQMTVTFLNPPYNDKYCVIASPRQSSWDNAMTPGHVIKYYYPVLRVQSMTTASFKIYTDTNYYYYAISIGTQGANSFYIENANTFSFVAYGGRSNPNGTA